MASLVSASGEQHGKLLFDGLDIEGTVPEAEEEEVLRFDGRNGSRSTRNLGALAGVASMALVGALVWTGSRTPQPSHSSSLMQKSVIPQADEVGVRLCGPTSDGVDFVYDGDWFDSIDHVASVGECCNQCKAESKCDGFTWVKDANLGGGNPGQCWLKSGRMTGKNSKTGVISGFREAKSTEDHEQAHAAAKAQHEAQQEEPDHEEDDGADEDPLSKCAASGEGCLKSHCCKDPGHQCFTKNEYWAQCMTKCTPGPNILDQVSPMPWACKSLGEKTPGTPKSCSSSSEDCSTSKCCTQAGTQCFEKNASFAQCKSKCEPGPDLKAADWLPWSCEKLGPWTMGAAPWVGEKCAKAGADCSKIQCCADAGHQCYKQSQYWAECKPSCTEGKPSYPGGPPWECTTVGPRTPSTPSVDASGKGKIGQWVEDRCSNMGENCLDTQCCHEVDARCYTKNPYWAMCKSSCSTEPDPNDGNKTWDCKALGPQSWGLATKGYPSLYCISLFMPSHYEGPLLQAQLKSNAGIFQCDGYDLFAAENSTLGTSKDGILVKAVLIPKIAVGVSQDGTAGNAKLFMAVWDKVIAGNRFRYYDFTIKVDPDAVIIPWRMRNHIKPHIGKNAYVVNCNKFPGSPNFPMMFGSIEVFTHPAMLAYAVGSWKCGSQLPWGSWGEDYYMTHCLDFLGVGRINDFGVVGDQVCTGANCADQFIAAFHPFKTNDAWFNCWTAATAPPPAAPAAPPR